jgi:hypothetical protein
MALAGKVRLFISDAIMDEMLGKRPVTTVWPQ